MNTGINYGTEIEIIKIAKLYSGKPPSPTKDAMIGFISPTHGFNFPPIMLHFLLRFPRSNQNSAFIVNTRGGLS